MADDYVFYNQNQSEEDIFEVHAATIHTSDVLDSAAFQNSIETMESDSYHTKFLQSCLLGWINYHLPFDLQAVNIDGDLRDGVRLFEVMKSLNLDPVLPYPKPANTKEREDNIYSLVSYIDNVGGFGMGADNIRDCAVGFCDGQLGETLGIVFLMARFFVIDRINDPVLNKCGIEQLEFWMQNHVHISESILCRGISISNIEKPEILTRLLNYFKIPIPDDYYDLFSNDQKNKYCQQLFVKETGVPPFLNYMIHIDEDEEEYNDLGWYLFLRYLWISEIYNALIRSRATGNKFQQRPEMEIMKPKEIIIRAIGASYKRDIWLRELEDNCRILFDWIQAKIVLFKQEMSSFQSGHDIGTRNLTLLTELYKIINEEQTQYSKLKVRCYELHCKIQRQVKNEDRDPLSYHPIHNIHNIENKWNHLVELERRVENNMQSFLNYAENRQTLLILWNREVSNLQHWMKRWQNFFLEDDPRLRFNTNDIRKRLIAFNQDFSNEINEKHNTEEIKLLANMLVDFTVRKDEQRKIETTTNYICSEYEQFILDSMEIVQKFDKEQQEGRDLEVMYSEMGDLLCKLDDQIHELHEYYSLRPHCSSLNACDKLGDYAKDTWCTLFEISYEIDAVNSLEHDIRDMLKDVKLYPKNYLTNVTPNYIRQRWEALLREAANMEKYIQQQRTFCLKHQPEIQNFNAKLLEASEYLNRKMIAVSAAEKCDNEIEIVKIRDHLVISFQETYIQSLVDLADSVDIDVIQLHDSVERILELKDCALSCVAAIDLVLSDRYLCAILVREREIAPSAVAKFKDELWWSADCNQLLPSLEQVSELLESGKDVDQLKEFVRNGDPLNNRVTFSSWLNFRRPNLYTTMNIIEKELNKSFMLLSENNSYILEDDVRQYVDKDKQKYFFKYVTEYFGQDYIPEDNGNQRAYDYRRLACNLVGRHQKLLVPPEYC